MKENSAVDRHQMMPVRFVPDSGITLIEMIVVIAIIAVVAGLIIPSVIGRPDEARVTVATPTEKRALARVHIPRHSPAFGCSRRITCHST